MSRHALFIGGLFHVELDGVPRAIRDQLIARGLLYVERWASVAALLVAL